MNPYTSPQTNEPIAVDSQDIFAHLDFKTFKKLYYRSANLNCIAALTLIACVVTFSIIIWSFFSSHSSAGTQEVIILAPLGFLYLATVIGLIQRSSWGRVLCIILCILACLSIVSGNILGIVFGGAGLFACFGAPQLFGKNRFRHKDLKLEFKTRRKAMKLAKKS